MTHVKPLIFWIIISACFFSCSNEIEEAGWPDATTEAKPWTRWWWLGSSVDKENLSYNLETLSAAGIGGVEITPIYGVKGKEDLRIDYLTPQWMEMLAHTQAEGKRLGMNIDMNMGTGWPFGGPEVTIDEAATKSIFQEYNIKGGSGLPAIIVEDKRQQDVAKLSRLMAYSDKGDRIDITQTVTAKGGEWIAPKGSDWKVIALFVGKTFQKVKRAAPGGQGYVLDHFDKDAVNRYFSKFENAFNNSNAAYPHSFFNDSYEVYGADWTPTLLDEFEKRRGYKLENYFPEFLANGDNDLSVRVISDYRETIGDILRDNFTETWSTWAHEKGITTRNQAHGSPANLIDLYASVDIPECESFGITDFDIPQLRKDSIRKENDGDPTTLKYASSAAHISGKKYTSSETFTWLTEHFRTSLSQCKPEIDQMFVSGVNHVFFHGNTYSPKDAAWPGWKFYASVDMSPTNSIWRDADAFFSYITRVQSFLQYGEPDNDFLLYLPIYDIWKEQRGDNFLTFAIHGMRERLPEFYNTVSQISGNGYDLDYISDKFLCSTTVENGLLKTEGGASYKALILPAVKTIPLETIRKIEELAKAGAKIVFVDCYPVDVPGLSSLEDRKKDFDGIMTSFPVVESFDVTKSQQIDRGEIITGKDFKELLALCGVNKEDFKTDFGGDYIRRKHDLGHHYFLTMLKNKPVNGWVPIAVDAKSATLFDPMSGRYGKAATRIKDGKTEVFLQLSAGESAILKTYTDKTVVAEEWAYYQLTGNSISLNNNTWELTFPNSEPAIEDTFELQTLGSWTDLGNEVLTVNMGTGKYKTTFDFTKKENMEYCLSLGDVRESAEVTVNGNPVATLFAVPFETNIGKFLKDGENTVEIEVTNLPANRIADYDKRKVDWRIFEEINFVSITYRPTKFDIWSPLPSGLLGPVAIKEITPVKID